MTPAEERLLATANQFIAHHETKQKNWESIKDLMIGVIHEAKTEQDKEKIRTLLMANLKVLTSLCQQLVEYEDLLYAQALSVKQHLENKT